MLTQILFALLIFFLPSNLAYHFSSSTAIVQGTLVDYLLPKLYLTDIFILSILVFSLRPKIRPDRKLILFFLITLITSLLSNQPISALWFWLKLVELSFLVSWLRHNLKLIRPVLSAALPPAIIWQSLLALAQWFKQSSIVGFWFLGEATFNLSTPGIAKTNFFNSLKVLPYGTTPHPNVLAGFLAVYLSIIWFNSPKFSHPISTISKYIATALGLTTLYLTQSVSAWVSLILITILIGLKRLPSTTLKALLAGLMILGLFSAPSGLETASLYRRHQLNLAAVKMWLGHPLFGIGLNQFTVHLPQYTEIAASTRFLQPAHNIYLLLLTEAGLIGFVLVILALRPFFASPSIPLTLLLIIGLVDHYPLTLQTGQLLLAISLALAISPKSLGSYKPRGL